MVQMPGVSTNYFTANPPSLRLPPTPKGYGVTRRRDRGAEFTKVFFFLTCLSKPLSAMKREKVVSQVYRIQESEFRITRE
jgi:hypothetical protein